MSTSLTVSRINFNLYVKKSNKILYGSLFKLNLRVRNKIRRVAILVRRLIPLRPNICDFLYLLIEVLIGSALLQSWLMEEKLMLPRNFIRATAFKK